MLGRVMEAAKSLSGNVGHDGHPISGTRKVERRRHRVYVTRNTEYHFRDGFCVAVRDRRSGDFLQGHLAIHRRLQGGLKFFSNGAIIPNAGDPKPGEALFFAADGRDLVTSPLESIDRPSKALVEAYPEPPPHVPTKTWGAPISADSDASLKTL